MAKINQVKLKQDADAAEKAGRLDKAIDALKQIVQDNPRDWTTVNRIGVDWLEKRRWLSMAPAISTTCVQARQEVA